MHCTSQSKHRVKFAVIVFTILLFLPFTAWSAELMLGWDPPAQGEPVGYNIYYGEAGTEFKTAPRQSATADQTTSRISGLTEGRSYVFAMTSVDGAGKESAFSEALSYTVPVVDTDGDGVPDAEDGCPGDSGKTAPGECGCGNLETDTDADGIPDCVDTGAAGDADNDGMPDEWETANGLDPLVDDAAADLDNDGISNVDEYNAGTDPAQPAKNDPPEAPVPLSPADLATDVGPDQVLEVDAFIDPENDAHMATEWQIGTTADFAELVLEQKDAINLTQLAIPHLTLGPGTEYFWRVRFYSQGDTPSEWSTVFSFTTGDWAGDSDWNGIPDEDESDEETDLDGDGVPDNSQAGMKSVKIKNENRKVGVKCPAEAGAIESLESVDVVEIAELSGRPGSMPFGMVNFRVKVNEPGQTVRVTVYLPEPAPENARWFKYDHVNGWQDYSGHTTISADRLSVEVELTDGGNGDADGVANGVIVDPSGLGIGSAGTGGGGGGGCFIRDLME